jgi:hypothetical protein
MDTEWYNADIDTNFLMNIAIKLEVGIGMTTGKTNVSTRSIGLISVASM